MSGSEHDEPLSTADAFRTLAFVFVVLSVALMAAGLVLTHVLTPAWDEAMTSWLAANRTAGWDSVSRAGTFIANTLGVVVVAAAVTTFCFIRDVGRLALLLVVGLALEVALFLSVNYSVARPRPTAPHLGATPSTFSFPSGHVAATFVLYGGISVLVACRHHATWPRVLAWLVTALLVVWVGFSRVYAAQHHPTDVLAGLAMGIGALGGALVAIRSPWPAIARAIPPVGGGRDVSMLGRSQPSTRRPAPATVGPRPEEGSR